MFKRLQFLMLLLSMMTAMFLPAAGAQDMTIAKMQKLKLAGDDVIEVESNSAKGFNFPYYLFIPGKIDRSRKVHLFVETNNTGTATDDFEVHRQKALNLIKRSYPNRIVRSLNLPLLVPVFPRPKTNWQAYTHALDRDSLEINEGHFEKKK